MFGKPIMGKRVVAEVEVYQCTKCGFRFAIPLTRQVVSASKPPEQEQTLQKFLEKLENNR